MTLWLAKKLLRVVDCILEQAMMGRGRLALFVERSSTSKIHPYIQRAIKELE
jgi:hypothetical protein